MQEILLNSVYFGFSLTLIIYFFSLWLKNKTKIILFNPVLISSILIICILMVLNIDYDTYNNGAKYIPYFLTPTIVCLAVPLYKQLNILKKNIVAVISSILAGCLANAIVITILLKLFNMSNELAVSLLPKSITAPIAIGIAEELGGIIPITVFAVILSGIVGATIAPIIFKMLRIKNDVAQGLACRYISTWKWDCYCTRIRRSSRCNEWVGNYSYWSNNSRVSANSGFCVFWLKFIFYVVRLLVSLLFELNYLLNNPHHPLYSHLPK